MNPVPPGMMENILYAAWLLVFRRFIILNRGFWSTFVRTYNDTPARLAYLHTWWQRNNSGSSANAGKSVPRFSI